MKAIVQDEYGSADVLQLRDVEDPMVGRMTCSSGSRRRRGSWRLAPQDRPAVRDPHRLRVAQARGPGPR